MLIYILETFSKAFLPVKKKKGRKRGNILSLVFFSGWTF